MTEKATGFLQPVKDLFEVHKKHGLENYLFSGMRPFRIGGCRLELEHGTNVVHNYGNWRYISFCILSSLFSNIIIIVGSGVSWSIGCAVEVSHLVRKYLYERKSPDLSLRKLLQVILSFFLFSFDFFLSFYLALCR